MSKRRTNILIAAILAVLLLLSLTYLLVPRFPGADVTGPAMVLPFSYGFRVDGILNETGSMPESSSRYFWVNSGGYMQLKGGEGFTAYGDQGPLSKWRKLYAIADPDETDNGLHPQNIFRLFIREKFQDMRQQAYFKIDKYNLSGSSYRSASNGILLFNRTVDNNNLYYTGLRVDGTAVIKKKIKGVYYTMAQIKVISGPTYNRDTNPNLLPVGQWIGVRADVKNLPGDQVSIVVYADIGKTGRWTKVAEVIDNGRSFGGAAFSAAGYPGIRTDFMDVRFDDYSLSTVPN